jgi:hypothetical protein
MRYRPQTYKIPPRLSAPSFVLAAVVSAGFVFVGPIHATEAIDLRAGARTWLYGGGFGQGTTAGDFYGWAMAFGDIDGDGFTDFLSSSANSEGQGDLFGREYDVYLIFGRPRAEIDSVYAVDTPAGVDIVFHRGGFAMACADIDNDRYDDVILANNEVYVIFGAPRGELDTVYDFNERYPDQTPNPGYTPPDIHVVGSIRLGGAVHDILNFGYDAVARTLVSGDVNGDGFDDIVVGNHEACDPPGTCVDGAAYIIFGRPRDQFPSIIDVDYRTSLAHPDVQILGDTNDGYPFNLALGDLDGDGVDDLLASASGAGENNTTPGLGEIHGWWGKGAWRPLYDTQVDDFDFALQGSPGIDGMGGYGLGYRMETGDLDGDGRDDLIVGSDRGYVAILPEERRVMGEYRILFGRPRALWPKWGSAVDMTDVLVLGANTGDVLVDALQWGICFFFTTGNRDADGFDDLFVGAGQAYRPNDPNPTRAGGAYWIRGRARSQWDALIDLRDEYDMTVYGVDGCDGVGNCGGTGFRGYDLLGFVTAMGDIDGNGRDELFVAAPFADGPDNSIPECGEIYVIYDSDAGTPTSSTQPPSARATLLPNYPNPFTASTTFRVQAPRGESISLTVYDALGREVARPLAGAPMTDDEMEFLWTALDQDGRTLPSGVYFVKLRAGNESHARKVLLVR